MEEKKTHTYYPQPTEAMIWHMERLADALHDENYVKMAQIFNEAMIQNCLDDKAIIRIISNNNNNG